ncbi:hypothetical protein [Streptomyces sp. NPDC048172]|uniref:hypothetical protein n=1 Tax=Streptomyces sp. NPDC048172 TaxID=3365505 RepID=UPI0037192C64
MPADKAQGRGRSGPRHAAPRKPLLTRLNIPAGKAVAVAAVPTAMLVGMGFTPQLAQAKPLPKNPFKGDACVSAPDKEETEAEQEKREERAEKLKRDLKKEQAERDKAAKEKGSGDAGGAGDAGDADKSQPSDGADKPAPDPEKPSTPPSGGGGGDAEKPSTPAPDPSESEDEENPWYDPLGVGKKIEDAFTPKDEKEKEDPAKPAPEDGAKPDPEPSPSEPSEPSKPSKPSTPKPPSSEDGGDEADSPAKDRAGKGDKAGDAAQDAIEKAEKRAKAKEKAEDDKDKPGANEQGKNGKARAYDADKDAGKPFPCPEKGDYAGKGEQTPATIPNQPWYLKASSLTLKGASYKGIVEITMANGKTKKALKYTADELDIGDMHQTVKGPDSKTTHVKAADGSTSTIRGGQVTMYTEELKGKLFGLIPMTFSPESPPPLDLPFIYLTDVEVRQSAQFGGNLTVPGLHTYLTD